MLTAEEARKQSKSKVKEWVVNDLEYLEGAVLDAIGESDETFASVDLKHLHKDALEETLKALKELGYKAFLSEKNLVLQWGKPLEEKKPTEANFAENNDDPYDSDEDDKDTYADDDDI